MRRLVVCSLLVLAVCLTATTGHAQAVDPDPIAVGQMAPDFELPGATRWGVLENPVRLSDLRGEVVVLAFFFRARTRG